MNQQFDSTKPLLCCQHPKLRRKVGVTVSEPFQHQGLGIACVEVQRESVTVNTETLVTLAVPADNWKPVAREFTEKTIDRLEEIIAELSYHRDRLKTSLQQINPSLQKQHA